MTPEALVIENLFQIQDKHKQTVDFKLNPSQRKYDAQRTNRDIICKPRQKGFSSFRVAVQTVKCLGEVNTRAVLISHEAKSTQRLLDKARFYIEHMNSDAKPELGRHNRNEFYFPRTESTFYIGTAGAGALGRGDTITDLHISEYAWWESDALEHVAGIFQSVPISGTICIESTGHGRANDFFYMVKNHRSLGYNVFFVGWWEDDEYQIQVPEQLVGRWTPVGFERYFDEMADKYKLSEAQLYWYWIKLNEFRRDLKYMQQEYPSSLMECFQATGGAVFPNAKQVETAEWIEEYQYA